tara:strand:+ start:510 stop:1082 length:573 start_codon:yes stop_codon:yes gene_type:complete
LKILLLRKNNCPYCDKALEFLRDTDHTIGVLQADKRFDKFPNDIGWKPDVVFSFKNYMILPKKITDSTLCINFHPGPPEHPGSCSANWALYNHDSEFGVTAHFMNDLVDNGLIFRVRRFPINPEDSLDDLLDKANIEVLLLFQEVVKDMTTTWKGKARTGKDLDKLISTPFRNMTEKLRLDRATKRRKRV